MASISTNDLVSLWINLVKEMSIYVFSSQFVHHGSHVFPQNSEKSH